MHRVAQLTDLFEALLRARQVLARHHDLHERAVFARARGVRPDDTLDVSRDSDDGFGRVAVSDDEDRLGLTRGKVRREHLEPRGRLGLHPELLDLVEAD